MSSMIREVVVQDTLNPELSRSKGRTYPCYAAQSLLGEVPSDRGSVSQRPRVCREKFLPTEDLCGRCNYISP